MKKFLFAFDFKERTMNDYIITFLKERKIDFFYQYPGTIVADLFGCNEYYKLEVDDVVNSRKEVYYCTDHIYQREGLERLYPLENKAISTQEPCYTIKVLLENNDTFTTRINSCKQYIFNEYAKQVFNMGTVEDNLQRVAWVEILA